MNTSFNRTENAVSCTAKVEICCIDSVGHSSKAEITPVHIIALTAVNGIFILVGSLGNLLVCMTIIKNPRLHIGTNFLILNLSIGDILVCLLVQPMYICAINLNQVPLYFPCIYRIMAEISTYMSFHTLFCIAAKRLLYLSRPFDSPLILTKKQLLVIFFTIWTVSFLMGTLSPTISFANEILRYYKYIFNFVFIAIYVRIFTIANQHFKKLSKLRKSVMFNHTIAKLKRENVSIRTTALIVGAFIASFFPFTVLKLAGIHPSTSETRAAYKWAVTLIYCSSSYNPFIYFIRSDSFRNGLKRTLSSH